MKKEDLISAVAASTVFVVFFLLLHWNIIIAIVLAVGIYFALSFLIKPRRKIGSVDVESLQNGEDLETQLNEAREDIRQIEQCGRKAQSQRIQTGSASLVRTGTNILHYLEQHIDQIPQARRFLNYYLDTASAILTKYIEFQRNDVPEKDMRQITQNTESAIDTLKDAFSGQYSRLLQGDEMNMEVDIDVLKNIAQSDSGSSPFSAANTNTQNGGTQS